MKTEMKRREFLKATGGATGAAALLGTFGGLDGIAAEGGGKTDKAALEALLKEMETRQRQFLSVPRKDGQFLSLLIKATRAKNVLEVGTSHGYSAIWISLGLEETGGHLTTIEILPERVQMAKDNLGKARLAHRVTFKQGDAHEIVPTLDGPFDFVFLDADKQGQMDYFNKLHPKKLVPGGILAVHNAIRLADSMQDFLDLIAKHADFDSVILSLTMDDGFCVNYRHRK